MGVFQNLDLLTVGITVGATIVLGFTVYISNTKSSTNRTFFAFSFTTALWGTVNYLSYQFSDPLLVLWLLRGILFFAVFQAFFLYQLFLVFPDAVHKYSKHHFPLLIPLVILAALASVSPFGFERLVGTVSAGKVALVMTGPGMLVFALPAIGFVGAALYQLISKLGKSEGNIRHALWTLLWGVATTFVLIIFFNLVVATVFHNPRYIPLGALFTFPFIAAASYAILREHLFNIKVIGVSILVLALSIASFAEIIFSNSLVLVLFRSSVFLLILIIGVSLIRGVLREVEQREKIEKLAGELEIANERLKQLDQLKSEFLSVASHQLRAPITAIKGYLANILEDSYGVVPEYLKEPLAVTQESARIMTSSIEDYLDVSRIEQGRMKFEFSEFDITPLARRAVEEMQPVAQKKGLELVFLDSPEAKITADFGKIKQVFTNLIDNSIKYTGKGSVKISVALAKTATGADAVRFMTQDTGIGIPADEIGKLFEKFTRARDANKVNTTGTGLGLYVVKNLVEGHGGKVWAESDGPGKGSRFIVELPVVPKEQPADVPAPQPSTSPLQTAASA